MKDWLTLVESAYWGGVTQIDQHWNVHRSCRHLSGSRGFANWLRCTGCDSGLHVSSVEEDIKGDHQYSENASGNERTRDPRSSTNFLRLNQFGSCMCEMSHIRVEAWRTARQMVTYRFVGVRRPACQNPERIIRRAAFTLGIRKSLREIGTGKLKEILFSPEHSTFFSVGYHSQNCRRPFAGSFQTKLAPDLLKCLAELRLRGMTRYAIGPADLFPRITLHAPTEHVTYCWITMHQEFIYKNFHFERFPGIP